MKLQLTNLDKIGLSQRLSSMYVILLSSGPVTISALTQKMNIPRTTCYHRLNQLKKEGYIIEYIKNKKRLFVARDPKVIIDKSQNILSEAKKANEYALSIVKQLRSIKLTPPSNTRVKFYEGKESVWDVFEFIIKTNNDSYWYGFGRSFLDYYDFQKFINDFSKRRRQFGRTKSYSILPGDEVISKISKRGETDFQEFRFMEKNIDFDAGFCIFGSNVVVFSLDKEISATLIQGKATAELLKSIFLMIWNILPTIN